MMRVIRSPQAHRDILEVLAYTKQRWGILQAREYRKLLKEAIDAITKPEVAPVWFLPSYSARRAAWIASPSARPLAI